MPTFPEPIIDAESRPFYEAAAEGRFLIKRCITCNEPHWHPRQLCPFCFGPTEWEEASGRGSIYSYTVSGKGADSAVLAYVTLAEGPTMLTGLVDVDPADLAIGQPVALSWQEAGSARVPCFAPA